MRFCFELLFALSTKDSVDEKYEGEVNIKRTNIELLSTILQECSFALLGCLSYRVWLAITNDLDELTSLLGKIWELSNIQWPGQSSNSNSAEW